MAKKITDGKEDRLPNLEGSSYLKLHQSQVARKNVFQISELLNTGMSSEAVDISMKILEAGVSPYALYEIIHLMCPNQPKVSKERHEEQHEERHEEQHQEQHDEPDAEIKSILAELCAYQISDQPSEK